MRRFDTPVLCPLHGKRSTRTSGPPILLPPRNFLKEFVLGWRVDGLCWHRGRWYRHTSKQHKEPPSPITGKDGSGEGDT